MAANSTSNSKFYCEFAFSISTKELPLFLAVSKCAFTSKSFTFTLAQGDYIKKVTYSAIK
jgi:hypothetical protein